MTRQSQLRRTPARSDARATPGHAREEPRVDAQIVYVVSEGTREIPMGFADVQRMRPATLRRLLGRPTFALELELHRIDCLSSHGKLDNYLFLLDKVAELEDEPPIPEPLISGRDVMEYGVPEGPEIGRILKAPLRRAVAPVGGLLRRAGS